jgi:putative ABC transport system substrate-binding protein
VLAAIPLAQRPSSYIALLEGLRDLGYVEGKTLTIHYLSADMQFDRFAALAAECVRLKPDVIVTHTTPGALAARKATSTIPIIAGPIGDPVGTGIVASLARPGGNATAMSLIGPGLSAKRLELLKEALPKMARASLLANLGDPLATAQVKETEGAARALGVQLRVRDVRSADALGPAFTAAVGNRDDALLTTIEAVIVLNRPAIIQLAMQHGLPAMFPYREFADAGGLMSYGPDVTALWRRVATYVDKIVKGAKPGDLPVEQPTKLELVLNLKTAKALNLTIPPALVAKANQIIQ